MADRAACDDQTVPCLRRALPDAHPVPLWVVGWPPSKNDQRPSHPETVKGGLNVWEYKTIELITLEPMAIEKVLNDLGKANWELISYAFADQGTTGFAVPRRRSRHPDRRLGKSTRRKAA
jgi:hypothetical protein